MEDSNIFTKPDYKTILNKYVNEAPKTPSGPNYESGRKLLGQQCLADGLERECAFNFSESASPTLRTLALYRDEQIKIAGNKLSNITDYIKPVQDIIDRYPISKEDEALLDLFPKVDDVTDVLSKYNITEELPFYKKYMKINSENNVDNFMKILKELPKEWTIIQLTAPYNPNENIKPFTEHRTEIQSIYITLLSSKYFDSPITIEVPANVTKEGEKPLFEELYSLLEENFNTIDNSQRLNNKRLVQNYWSKREDIDLRMKSIINVMFKEWLGGFSSLLTGRLLNDILRDRIVYLVDTAINDWGFIRLTDRQKMLIYNLIENSPALSSQQIRSCLRIILTEHGNTDDIRKVLKTCCNCNADFKITSELCLKCLSQCFEKIHNLTLVDAIKALSQVATQVKDGDGWSDLKNAKRQPVILIVDEMLDTFPWESLPILTHHPVTRIENIHFLYALYKTHENRIVDGYYSVSSKVGRYIINPDNNLDRMERRMTAFVNYWCKSWSGHAGQTPSAEQYLQCLTEAGVFLYCGHGDGLHMATSSSHIEGVSCGAVCVLSGCGSLRLVREGSRIPPAAAHHHLHVAGCPMVIGMLWEVTDLEVDKMVTTMISLFVPSDAPCDWKSVGKGKWSQGAIDIPSNPCPLPSVCDDVLLAVSRSRSASNFTMIASSLVVRGIPVKIV